MAAWAARTVSLKAQMKRQETVAMAVYQRERQHFNQALKLALAQGGIYRSRTYITTENLLQSEMFLLSPMVPITTKTARYRLPSM